MDNLQKARQLIDDDFMDQIEAIMKGSYIHMWARQEDQDKRNQLWLAYNMVDDLRVAIQTLAQTGEMPDGTA